MTALRAHLEELVAGGRKLLVPYLMAGIPDRDSFDEALAAVSETADAVELGLPFSDPLMDGPVIAEAAQRALRAGVGPVDALEAAPPAADAPPRIAMTYYNPIHRTGEKEFCERAAAAGLAGLVVPDLPVEESRSLRDAAAAAGLAWIPLVAPTSPPGRVAAITETATGFVYAVSTLGVTGTREQLSERAARVVAACRAVSDAPVLVGIGVSSPAHAVEAAATADGVVIGTAVVRLVLEEGAASAGAFLAEVRAALDAA
ncbi:MAG: tryptophan synthase subunit alpha [Actinomycetota bacterium]